MTNRKEAFVNGSLQFLRVWLPKNEGIGFTAEALAIRLFELGFPSADDRRWFGTVFQRAKREGLIKQLVFAGERQFETTKANHKTPIWVRA